MNNSAYLAEKQGVKAQLVDILRPLEKPATYAELWEQAKDLPVFKSKRFMKQMLQQLRKANVAKTKRVDARHFGYLLTYQGNVKAFPKAVQATNSTEL